MPELRKDPVVGRWVIISPERGKRPSDYAVKKVTQKDIFCPLCPGNEATTPPEIFAFRKEGTGPDRPGWNIRVVPNKFPALEPRGNMERRREGVFDRMNGVGSHEVVIETPDHDKELTDLPLNHVKKILFVFKMRTEELAKDPRFQSVVVFKNRGREAGASLQHSHSQIIALPIIPKLILEELYGGRKHYRNKERCIFCDMIEQERQEGIRIIDENDDFVSFSPYAARFPFETWITPRMHTSHYCQIQQHQYQTLAKILLKTLKRLDTVLEKPPYNLVFHTAPILKEDLPFYHWHIEIIPKVTKVAGFEWGTGFYINPTPPEEAAAYLREAPISE